MHILPHINILSTFDKHKQKQSDVHKNLALSFLQKSSVIYENWGLEIGGKVCYT
jgi:hypothetical protein